MVQAEEPMIANGEDAPGRNERLARTFSLFPKYLGEFEGQRPSSKQNPKLYKLEQNVNILSF